MINHLMDRVTRHGTIYAERFRRNGIQRQKSLTARGYDEEVKWVIPLVNELMTIQPVHLLSMLIDKLLCFGTGQSAILGQKGTYLSR